MEKKKNILFRYYDCLLGKPKELTETGKVARKAAFLYNNHLLKDVMREKIKQQNLVCICKESQELFEELITAKWGKSEGKDFQKARGNSGGDGYVHHLASGAGCMGVYMC